MEREKLTANRVYDDDLKFEFGRNWSRFLAVLNEDRIDQAIASLRTFLGVEELEGLRFLDIGCGSGLSSLAARRLCADVTSFDYDPESVACTEELRRRYYSDDTMWRIEQGSALDREYLCSLGKFDVVYSWGVLHHTGAMWLGIENAISCVVPKDGKLFIAIYNDQGWKSHLWWFVKLVYNRMPRILRPLFIAITYATSRFCVFVKYAVKLNPSNVIRPLLKDRRERGMSAKYDKIDWIGGFPYEFAKFEILVSYLEARGFVLIHSNRNSSLGCHEMAFKSMRCAE